MKHIRDIKVPLIMAETWPIPRQNRPDLDLLVLETLLDTVVGIVRLPPELIEQVICSFTSDKHAMATLAVSGRRHFELAETLFIARGVVITRKPTVFNVNLLYHAARDGNMVQFAKLYKELRPNPEFMAETATACDSLSAALFVAEKCRAAGPPIGDWCIPRRNATMISLLLNAAMKYDAVRCIKGVVGFAWGRKDISDVLRRVAARAQV